MSANGKLADWELVTIAGVRLEYTTAKAFANMTRDCLKATGVTLDVVNKWGGYRDRGMQKELNASYRGPLKLLPVGFSTHGYGTALDLTYPSLNAAATWLKANCAKYGFKYPPSWDRNHFLHVTSATGPTVPASPSIPKPLPEEDPMYQYRSSVNPTSKKTEWLLINPIALPDGHLRALTAADATGWAQIAGNSELIAWDQFAGAIDRAKAAHAAYMAVEAKKAALYGGGSNGTINWGPLFTAIDNIPTAVNDDHARRLGN